jgi:hypothetical protein
MLRPNRDLFVGMCKSCKHPVPIVFQDLGSCLHCDANLRIAYHAWANRLSLMSRHQEAEHEQEVATSEHSPDGKR